MEDKVQSQLQVSEWEGEEESLKTEDWRLKFLSLMLCVLPRTVLCCPV